MEKHIFLAKKHIHQQKTKKNKEMNMIQKDDLLMAWSWWYDEEEYTDNDDDTEQSDSEFGD